MYSTHLEIIALIYRGPWTYTHTPNETLSEVHQLVGKQDIQDTEASSQS